MKPLLGREGREVVALLGSSKTLLAFDYDGTLAPIVDDRDEAGMRPHTRALLVAVSHAYPLAVISGRARDDVKKYLRGVHTRYVVGNHGLDRGHESPELVAALEEPRAKLTHLVARFPGVELEDKRYSLTVHYRHAADKDAVRAAVLGLLERLVTPVRIIPGKCVLNVVLEGTPHKGDAVLALSAAEGAERVLYVGDDATDEDVFRLECGGLLFTVRVGRAPHSAAQWFLADQPELDVLLGCLLAARGVSAPTEGA